MKHAIIKYGTAALCALLFAGAAFALPQVFPRSVSAAAAQEKAARVGDSEYDSFKEALHITQTAGPFFDEVLKRMESGERLAPLPGFSSN